MFRKLVSALPYSPALVGQIGFYAGRLKKEEATRRVGLVFTALALVVQSLAVISPPEAANASSANDFVRGGVRDKAAVMSIYDASANGNGDFKDILDYAGITRAELDAARETQINSRQFGTGDSALLSWGRTSRFSAAQGEVRHIVPRSDGTTNTVFSRPLWRYDSRSSGSTYTAYVGQSAKIGYFAIIKDCGNLVTRKSPTPVPKGALVAADCTFVRGWAYDERKADARSSVYLYFGGPPGQGERVGPIVADDATPTSPRGTGFGFSYAVPEKYRRSATSTAVYAVMIPLSGWHSSTVAIGSARIPGNCVKPEPVAECATVKTLFTDRTKRTFQAAARTANGATIKSYTFQVKDKTGKVVDQKTVTTSAATATSPTFTMSNTGDYTVSVSVATSVGTKTSAACATSFAIAAPDKCPYTPALTKEDKDCKPCPGNSQLWIKDEECAAKVVQGKDARNLTQDVAAVSTPAKAGDRIEYTVYMENIGTLPTTTEFTEDLSDVMEYAALRNAGGGQLDEQTKLLSFGTVSLKPGEKQTRTITVQMLAQIPSAPQGTSEPSSYDCKMSNTFGNNVSIMVDCPPVKGVENTVRELPKTGPGENMIFGAAVASTATYFWARSRQLKKEIRLVRHHFAAGTI